MVQIPVQSIPDCLEGVPSPNSKSEIYLPEYELIQSQEFKGLSLLTALSLDHKLSSKSNYQSLMNPISV